MNNKVGFLRILVEERYQILQFKSFGSANKDILKKFSKMIKYKSVY